VARDECPLSEARDCRNIWAGSDSRLAPQELQIGGTSKLLLDGHFNLLAGLLPIPKDTTPHDRFTKRQFTEAPASPTMATAIHLPAR
jgi:hypothetical protein